MTQIPKYLCSNISLALHFFFHEAFCDISHRLGGITPFGVFYDAFLQDVGHLCLRYCKNVNLFYNLNCRMCPLTQGYRIEPLFHTKRRSGRDR
jgi:hypothetical protein